MDFTKALNRLGESAIMREDEPDDIGAAFQKFAVVTKELALLMKDLVSHGSKFPRPVPLLDSKTLLLNGHGFDSLL